MEIKGTEIRVEKGDITGQKVDVVVNAANNCLLMGGGVAGYVIHAATMGMDFETDEEKIRQSTRNSLRRAKEHLGYTQRKLGRYPIPTVDIIIEYEDGVVLIKRKNPPFGWAIPGGFVDWGESLEAAAIREAKEETNLGIKDLRQFHTYSAPGRDPRFHTISTVFVAKGEGNSQAKDDAVEIGVFTRDKLPQEIVFDHRQILTDYFSRR
ncbi:MAG: NUDIX domain-containing protein [Candidatus Omnitrophota bacterium]